MRAFPRSSTVSVQIYRSPTGGVVKYPTTPTYIVEGNLLPYYRRGGPHSLEGGMFVIEFELYLAASVDIKRSDELIINGTKYYVRTLINLNMGTTPFIAAYISTAA